MDYFHLSLGHDEIAAISSLGLAHVGDGVFELMVRSWLCVHCKATNRGLHKATVQYVAAPAQARAAAKIPIRIFILSPEAAIIIIVITLPGELTPTSPTSRVVNTNVPVMPPAIAAITSFGFINIYGK